MEHYLLFKHSTGRTAERKPFLLEFSKTCVDQSFKIPGGCRAECNSEVEVLACGGPLVQPDVEQFVAHGQYDRAHKQADNAHRQESPDRT